MRVVSSQRTRHSRQWRATLGGLAVLGAALLVWFVVIPALRAEAADFPVNVVDGTDVGGSTGHADDADVDDDGAGGGTAGDGIVNGTETPDGNCDIDAGVGGNQCSLRAAIFEADGSGADDTVSLPAASVVTLGASLTIADTGLTVNGNGSEISVGGGFVAITIDADRVTLNNLLLDGEGAGTNGITLNSNTDDAVLSNLTIRSFTSDGIFQIGSTGARNRVQNNTITTCTDDGVDWGEGPDAQILGNTITNNGNDGLETGGADNLLVQGNTFSGNAANQINILGLAAGEDIDILQNNITSTSDGIRIGAGVSGGDIGIGLTVENRNVFRGALGAGEFHVFNGSTVNVNAENNDWDAYSAGAIEGVVCHNSPDSDANCVGEGTGIVDYDPFINAPMPLPTPTATLGPATETPTVTPTVEGTPPAGAMEDVPLALGCNFEASTYADATTPADLANAVMPGANLAGLWAQQPAPQWRGYNPLFPEVSDMGPVDRLDVLAICMIGPGTFTRPII